MALKKQGTCFGCVWLLLWSVALFLAVSASYVKYSYGVDNNAVPQDDEDSAEYASELTEAELNLLKKLKIRHEKLISWEKDLFDKENMMRVLSDGIALKLASLAKIKQELEQLVSQYKKAENKKIADLIKVYESMKPQEAAQIFQDLDMSLLVSLLAKMQENKLAAILGKMNVDKAREITTNLATYRTIPSLGQECSCK